VCMCVCVPSLGTVQVHCVVCMYIQAMISLRTAFLSTLETSPGHVCSFCVLILLAVCC
jgi:hypothetical protein